MGLPGTQILGKGGWTKLLALISFLLIGLILFQSTSPLGLNNVFARMGELSLEVLVFVGIVATFQFLIQCLRNWVLFPNEIRPSLYRVVGVSSWGQTVNLFAPARAGDVVKIALFNKLGDPNQGGPFELAGTLASDKLIDILSLALLVIVSGVQLSPYVKNMPTPPVWLVLTVVAAILSFPIVNQSRTFRWISVAKEKGLRVLRGCGALGNPTQFIFALSVGLSCWIVEGWILKSLCEFYGFSISFEMIVLALTILNFGIAIPISLANLGVFEASLAFGLTQAEIPLDIALAIAATHHVFQVLGVIVWFVPSFLFFRRKPLEWNSREFRVQSQDKNRALAYYDQISLKYDQKVSSGILNKFRECERKAILDLAWMSPPAKTLIDIGCGGGFYSIAAKKAGLWVKSIDASQGMIVALRGKVDEVQVADVENLQIEGQFDRVLCLGVLDFVVNPEQALIRLCRLVAPGGRLVLFVPRSGWAGWIYRLEKRGVGIRINLFKKQWIQNCVERKGLKLVDTRFPLPTNMVLAFVRTK